MVAIVRPESKIIFGEFEGDLESSLRDYSSEFIKEINPLGIDYMLFDRQDPSLLSVFQTYDFKNRVGITVVSYDLSLNEKIFADVISKTGVVPLESPPLELIEFCRKKLKEIYIDIFSKRFVS
jgi:hypothetical protein